jgi:hypothetical protein
VLANAVIALGAARRTECVAEEEVLHVHHCAGISGGLKLLDELHTSSAPSGQRAQGR